MRSDPEIARRREKLVLTMKATASVAGDIIVSVIPAEIDPGAYELA